MKPEEYLPNLSEEATKISDLLHGLVFSDAIYYMKDEIFTADRLIANFSKYGDKFDIFYFSGHASDGALKLSDNFITDSDKMADVINVNLKNLQLGFFNACETFDLAKKIVNRRVKTQASNRLVMITCGCQINAFFAERFATLFFNHVGRPGTYYDAFKNASTLMSLVNSNLRFREFYDYQELETATADFDYAFIDIPIAQDQPATVAAAGGTAAPLDAHIPFGSAAQVPPKRNGSVPHNGSASPVSAPAAPVIPAACAAIPADSISERSATEPISGAAAPVGSNNSSASGDNGSSQHGASGAGSKPTKSIINTDKKTLDILSANYIKECTQTVMNSKSLDSKQIEILNDAIKGTQDVANGNNVTGKVKQLWREAARILPGVDSKSDFKSLVQVSKKSYDKALDQFFGNTTKQPTLANMQTPKLQEQD